MGFPAKTIIKNIFYLHFSELTLPLYWESMDDGTDFQRFELSSSSQEYRRVESAFKRTASRTVMKVSSFHMYEHFVVWRHLLYIMQKIKLWHLSVQIKNKTLKTFLKAML